MRMLLTKYGPFCWYCGIDVTYRERHVDHIIPTSKGGDYHWDNLALACARCNFAKRDSDLEDFLGWIDHIRSVNYQRLIELNSFHPHSNLFEAKKEVI